MNGANSFTKNMAKNAILCGPDKHGISPLWIVQIMKIVLFILEITIIIFVLLQLFLRLLKIPVIGKYTYIVCCKQTEINFTFRFREINLMNFWYFRLCELEEYWRGYERGDGKNVTGKMSVQIIPKITTTLKPFSSSNNDESLTNNISASDLEKLEENQMKIIIAFLVIILFVSSTSFIIFIILRNKRQTVLFEILHPSFSTLKSFPKSENNRPQLMWYLFMIFASSTNITSIYLPKYIWLPIDVLSTYVPTYFYAQYFLKNVKNHKYLNPSISCTRQKNKDYLE